MKTIAYRLSILVSGINPHHYRLILTLATLSIFVVIGGAPISGGNTTG